MIIYIYNDLIYVNIFFKSSTILKPEETLGNIIYTLCIFVYIYIYYINNNIIII